MKRFTATGLSLPVRLMQEIDKNRGDIPRSRYLLRVLEKQYTCKECRKNGVRDSLDNRFESLKSSGSHVP
jgi:hypothetical protein